MEDLTSFDSEGPAKDIQNGAVWSAINEIRADVKDLAKETKAQSITLARMEGKIEGKEQKDERSFNWKHGATMTFLAGFIAFLAAKFS